MSINKIDTYIDTSNGSLVMLFFVVAQVDIAHLENV